jgi:transglutaminase-like putative cysteine protease
MRLPIAAGLATAAVSLTLYPLFEGGSWFWANMGAIIVVAAAGMGASRLTALPWAAPPVMLLALGVYLTAAFTGSRAWAGFIPTKDSVLLLGELLGSGFDDIQRFAAPVPANTGITLLTAGGVGVMAVLVDLFTVRLRRAALAGLPLLALFTVPAAVLTDPISWPAFVIGAFGYVGLLVADGRERLGKWGRAVFVRRTRTVTADAAPDTGRLALSGRRIGVTAIGLAVLLPALLPNLAPAPLFAFGVGNGLGPGGGNIGIPDAIAELGGELRQEANDTVLTYTSSDDQPRYLRIYSLDVFDGTKWTVNPLRGRPEDRVSEGPLPPAPGLDPATPVKRAETRISISDDIRTLRFLPLPYPATQVAADGDWRADRNSLMVFSTDDEAAGLDYRAVTGEPQPTPEQLDLASPEPDSAGRRYLDLPPGLDPRVAGLAERVTAGATTRYQQAVKLQEWFTKSGTFTYSLRASGSGGDALSRFILTDRSGYCEQFASAMAVMARMLGIPAKVSIGFTGGTKIGDAWTVRTHDAHAWPELYFAGVGWLRFEPTPGGGAGQGTAQVPQYTLPVTPTASPSPGASPGASAGADDTTGDSAPAPRNPREFDRDLGGVPVVVDPGMPLPVKIAIGVAAALLILLIPAVVRVLSRHRRRRALDRSSFAVPDPGVDLSGADLIVSGDIPSRSAPTVSKETPSRGAPAVEAAWAELGDMLTDFGMARRPGESPRALGRRVAETLRTDAGTTASITAITSAEERRRYARTIDGPGPVAADLKRVRRALSAAASRKRRLGAALAPLSTLLRLRALGEKALDGFDRLENIRLVAGRSRGGAGDTAGNRMVTVRDDQEGGASRERSLTGSRS